MFELKICWCRPRHRLIPRFGPVTEQQAKPKVSPPTYQFERYEIMANLQLTDSQQVVYSISGVDARGNPVPLPAGTVQFSVDNPSLLALTPSADGSSVTCASVGPLGTATLTAKVVDASGNTLAAGSAGIDIIAGPVTAITLTPSTPTPQP